MSNCCNNNVKKISELARKSDAETVKNVVTETYGQVAEMNSAGRDCGNVKSCCGAPAEQDVEYSQQLGYSEDETKSVPSGANMGLGCGNPTAIANLKEGETVLDLGCGGGFDCFLAAQKVGTTGRVIGVDMTRAMIDKATKNAERGGYKNVEFKLGEIEKLPIDNDSIDVIISNCVVNLSTDKQRVFVEMMRVLKKGGRVCMSDIVATSTIPPKVKQNLELHAACIAGAMATGDLREMMENVGFSQINIQIKEESRSYIEKWTDDTNNARNFVASANIEGVK